MNNCAFDRGDTCSALNERSCENCSFRKTEQELREGREYAQKFLDRLPPDKRKAIETKYRGREGF